MIALHRLEEPAILAEKKGEWQARYAAKRAQSPKARPESKQYAHADVVSALEAMSHGKCFYCEYRDTDMTVDHYVEVAERPEAAFDWRNLYLACLRRQKKQTNLSIPVTDCLDPCHPDVRPSEHLAFEEELIRSRTPLGDKTIRKYRLNHGDLDHRRLTHLHRFDKALLRIREAQVADRGRAMNAEEREVLRRFAQADCPFSAMFGAYLEGLPDLRL